MNTQKITYGSVCSGIEAASVAWHDLFTPVWFAEIAKFPSAVLAHRFPSVRNLGDMTTIAERIASGEAPAPDILVGGTPCQAFSMAGLRGGLADERGQLTLSYVKLLNTIDTVRNGLGLPACIAVWENVPGVRSDKTNAFGCFIAKLIGESESLQVHDGKWPRAGLVSGDKRTVVWRTLDAQHIGVPQRRKRVFLVAGATASVGSFAEILFERSGGRGDPSPRGATRKENTGVAGAGSPILDDPTAGDSAIAHLFDHHAQDGRVDGPLQTCPTMAAKYGTGGGNVPLVLHGDLIRRLTPVECERLQGFPDGWTDVPWRNGRAPDGLRYKAVGNSMAVPCMQFVGGRARDYLDRLM